MASKVLLADLQAVTVNALIDWQVLLALPGKEMRAVDRHHHTVAVLVAAVLVQQAGTETETVLRDPEALD
jgi:hypothetical protein